MAGDGLTILVTDDDEGCRELYSLWVASDHEVWTASDGEEALDRLDDSVDLVILDRDMPGPSGTQVASRNESMPFDPYVVMISSRRPDFELSDHSIHGFARKPLIETDLQSVLQEFVSRRRYRAALDDFFALTSKVASIEADRSPNDLTDDDRYERLRWLVDEKRVEVDQALHSSDEDWSTAFRSFGPNPQPDPVFRNA